MPETLLFFGMAQATDGSGEATIWQSNSSGTTPLINANIGVNVGNGINVLGPPLLYANSSVLGVDAQYHPSWFGDPFYNQINMTVFNNNLYFSGTQLVGGQGVANLWQTDATLNSQGQATPTLVASRGVGGGLQPCSLTTGHL